MDQIKNKELEKTRERATEVKQILNLIIPNSISFYEQWSLYEVEDTNSYGVRISSLSTSTAKLNEIAAYLQKLNIEYKVVDIQGRKQAYAELQISDISALEKIQINPEKFPTRKITDTETAALLNYMKKIAAPQYINKDFSFLLKKTLGIDAIVKKDSNGKDYKL
ncbi:MAG: hypothetical protein JO149_00165, partial [Gammaproteobacteria bacterium]|nr:hypothetical protein [Gammaproteobacteria bacterium]